MNNSENVVSSRRQFLVSGSTAAAAAMAAPAILVRERAFAANSDTLKIGLVGCGGRGTGAAANALTADGNTILTAVGDMFPEPLPIALGSLKKQFPDRVQVTQDKQFTGLDAYKKVIDSGIDVVLLATPPGFRPYHLRYAVESGRQIFCEKPMATDATGVRHVKESVRMAKEKGLHLVCGFCWRSDYPRRELYGRMLDGAIGDIRGIYATYLTGPVKPMPSSQRRPAEMSDLEWQVRNWYNFAWLSGDGYVEQCIHSVDKVAWLMRDQPPIKCTATGGRMVPNYEGNIYDHMTVVYEYPNGVRATVAQRQVPGCYSDNSDYISGSKGHAINTYQGPTIKGETTWRYKGEKPDMYVVEHRDLFKSIRGGPKRFDGDWMWTSTLLGIMGRMAAYTGQEVTWEHALNSKEHLSPDEFALNKPLPIAPIPVPGRYKLV